MSDLIDTTEMYLRTVYELEEEGVPVLRARIAERLEQSGPTVSQTVSRMERDGLLNVEDDRTLALTDSGRVLATRVMRKHRLAECLLVEVIGLPWHEVHEEACRWEHVMSDQVERRIVEILGAPTESPFGNPIPGLGELGIGSAKGAKGAKATKATPLASPHRVTLSNAPIGVDHRVARISEPLQADVEMMSVLHGAGVLPGKSVRVTATNDELTIEGEGAPITLSIETGHHIVLEKESEH